MVGSYNDLENGQNSEMMIVLTCWYIWRGGGVRVITS